MTLKKTLAYFPYVLLLISACSVYKPVSKDKKVYKEITDDNRVEVINALVKDKRYKIIHDSTSYKLYYAGRDNKDLLFKKNAKTEDTIALEKKKFTKLEERKFSQFKTDMFTIASYAAGGSLIYLLLIK